MNFFISFIEDFVTRFDAEGFDVEGFDIERFDAEEFF